MLKVRDAPSLLCCFRCLLLFLLCTWQCLLAQLICVHICWVEVQVLSLPMTLC